MTAKSPQPPQFFFRLLLVVLFGLSFGLMSFTFQARHQQLTIASKLWSDFGAHIPLIRSFSMGDNFPPEYPTFPGEPIRYHYLMYAIVGLLEKVGLNIAFALNLVSALGFTLLLYLIAKITFTLSHSKLAVVITLTLFLFNGSLSFVEFFTSHPPNLDTPSDIIHLTNFSSFGPWDHKPVSAFWNLNIYTNQRHLGWGFGLFLFCLYPIIKYLCYRQPISRSSHWLAIPITLLLPLIHQAAFVALLVVLTVLAVANLRSRSIITYVLVIIVAGLPGIYHAYSLQGPGVVFQPGFLSPSTHPLELIKYWFFNLGLYLPLLPLIFIFSSRPAKVLLLAFSPLFILANLFKFTPDMINNHKLVNLFMLMVVILMSSLLVRILRRSLLYLLLVLPLTLSLTLSGLIDLFPILNDYSLTVNDLPLNPTASWIATHTPPNSIFLTSTYLYNPASLAGRRTWMDYGYFNWSLGYNDGVRKQALPQLFNPTRPLSAICPELSAQHITYILISAGAGNIPDVDPHLSTIAVSGSPVYTSPEDHQIYEVSTLCPVP